MKNLLPFAACLLAACLPGAFFSCRTTPGPDCHLSFALQQPLSLPLDDSSARSFILSPFGPDKIWVETGGSNPDILELDLKTQRRHPLTEAFGQIMSPPRNFAICPDPYEPLVWIGGNNCPLLKYGKRSNELTEMQPRYVTRIVSRADRTYFVAFDGFYFWDRQQQRLEKDTQVPLQIIQRSALSGENSIVLDGQYTYFFDRRKAEKGVWVDGSPLPVGCSNWKYAGGIALFQDPNGLLARFKGQTRRLPAPFRYAEFVRIDSPYVWFADQVQQNVYRYHAGSGETRVFGFRLPALNNYVLQYHYDKQDLLWMHRPGQLAFLDMKTGALHHFPLEKSNGFLRMIQDDCHLFLLFNNRLEVADKAQFQRACPALDAQAYDEALKDFRRVVDSTGAQQDTSPLSVLAKLKYLRQRYAGVEHLEIRRQLQQLDVSAFSGVPLRFPGSYEACYQNAALPLAYRQSCLYALMKEYTLRADFRKTLALDARYRELFGGPGTDSYGYRMNIDSVRRHVQRVDSLERLGLAPDSLAYFTAVSLFSVCQTDWFSGEACYHYGLLHKALQAFLKNWPQSRLADNAEYDLWSTSYCGEGGFDDGVTQEIIGRYKQILARYPDSDLGPEIEYQIFSMLLYLNEPDAEAAKKAGREYLRRYPDDVRAVYVREQLGQF